MLQMNTRRGNRAIALIMVATLIMSIIVLMFNFPTAEEATESLDRISEFENMNPVYDAVIDKGSAIEAANLPETIRAVVDIDVENSKFVQALPVAEEDGNYAFYHYGYVMDKNAEEKYKANETVLYTIYYADGSEGYRVYGSMNDQAKSFYACDKDGNITGVVKNIPVTWSCEDFDSSIAEKENIATAKISGYSYRGDAPTALITVDRDQIVSHVSTEELEAAAEQKFEDTNTTGCISSEEDVEIGVPAENCTCGIDSSSKPWEHDSSCPSFREPDESDCSCEGGFENHDFANESCILNILYGDMMTMSDNGGGSSDLEADQYMIDNIRTNTTEQVQWIWGEASGPKVSATWRNYVNTIWRNKAMGNFKWAKASTSTGYKGWVWSGKEADQTTDTVIKNPMRMPAASGGVWTVYSGEQLVYALKHFISGETIQLGGNINLDGGHSSNYNKNWETIYRTPANLTIDGTNSNGKNFTIYNLFINNTRFNSKTDYETNKKARIQFIRFTTTSASHNCTLTVKNLTFSNAKSVCKAGVLDLGNTNALFRNGDMKFSISNVHIVDSMFCSVDISTFATIYPTGKPDNPVQGEGTQAVGCFLLSNGYSGSIKSTGIKDCYMYQYCHVNPMVSSISSTAIIMNSYVSDTLIASVGVHSSGFMGCFSGTEVSTIQCFTNIEMYSTNCVGGFRGYNIRTARDCFSTGKLEGYCSLGGFGWCGDQGGDEDSYKTNERCYSTMLVGMRSNPKLQGGFMTNEVTALNGRHFSAWQFMTSCYAAGEVGNTDLVIKNGTSYVGASLAYCGGFVSQVADGEAMANIAKERWTNCYYDKQTTAMREVAIGNAYSNNILVNAKGTLEGLTTSTKKYSDAPSDYDTGMASGNDFGLGTTSWAYEEGFYPQLKAFTTAGSAAWGSSDEANYAKANSLASVTTVLLNTWNKGYSWSDEGVRTKDEAYFSGNPSASTHKGSKFTYDTVREITTDFVVTPDTEQIGASNIWMPLIPDEVDGYGNLLYPEKQTITIKQEADLAIHGRIHNLGVSWYRIRQKVSQFRAIRPIRLVTLMQIDAGEDKTIMSGQLYDHRSDVNLTMMHSITDDMYIDFDSNWDDNINKIYKKEWVTVKSGKYPNNTNYYKVPTSSTVSTTYDASQGAWINTEIWRAKKNSDGSYPTDTNGNYVPEYSVRVTGEGTGSNSTVDEKKWNGEYPLYPDTTLGQKYIVSYYWTLDDGRYVTDQKVITITPGQYKLNMNVYDLNTTTANSNVLYLGAGRDHVGQTGYTYSSDTISSTGISNIPYGTNVSAAWKKKSEATTVDKIKITFRNQDGTVRLGYKSVNGPIVAGTNITVNIDYYYTELKDDPVQGKREITSQEIVPVTYTVKQDAAGGFYLQLNKIQHPQAGETVVNSDTTGIPAGTNAFINDLGANVQIDLYVSNVCSFDITKNLSAPAEEDEIFLFKVEYRGKDILPSYTSGTTYARIDVKAGQSVASVTYNDTPQGWYTVTELDTNWRFDFDGDRLATDNVGAYATNKDDRSVTYWVE